MTDKLSALIGQFQQNSVAAGPALGAVPAPADTANSPEHMLSQWTPEQRDALFKKMQKAAAIANATAPAAAPPEVEVDGDDEYTPPARQEDAPKAKKKSEGKPRYRKPKRRKDETSEEFSQRAAELQVEYERRLAEYNDSLKEQGEGAVEPPTPKPSEDPKPEPAETATASDPGATQLSVEAEVGARVLELFSLLSQAAKK